MTRAEALVATPKQDFVATGNGLNGAVGIGVATISSVFGVDQILQSLKTRVGEFFLKIVSIQGGPTIPKARHDILGDDVPNKVGLCALVEKGGRRE